MKRRVMQIGLATHYARYTEKYSRKVTACGIIAPVERVTRDTGKVDCIRCLTTRQFRRAIGILRPQS